MDWRIGGLQRQLQPQTRGLSVVAAGSVVVGLGGLCCGMSVFLPWVLRCFVAGQIEVGV